MADAARYVSMVCRRDASPRARADATLKSAGVCADDGGMNRGIFGGVLLPVLVLAACSSGGGVKWSDYAPELKGQIDQADAADDCVALQAMFDTADANDAVQRQRVGNGNGELMGYIDHALRDSDCYR